MSAAGIFVLNTIDIMSVTRIGIKQTDDTVKQVAFLDDVSDVLNPFASFNKTGKINVGSKVTGKRKLVLALAHPRDIKMASDRPMPYPLYQFHEGTLENSTSIAGSPLIRDNASYESFVTNFNTIFSGKIKATAVGTLKCGDNLYNNGIRTIVEFELIGEYARRDDIFIKTLPGNKDALFIEYLNKLDGKQKGYNCYFFKDHTTTDITLNGESIWDHLTNSDVHTTAAEKSSWNNKQDVLVAGDNITISADNVISTSAPVPETTIPADDELKHNHLYILSSVDGLDLSSVTVEDYATVDLWIDYTAGTVTTSSDWSWVDGIELPATMSAGTRYMIELRNTGDAILAKLNYSYTNVND